MRLYYLLFLTFFITFIDRYPLWLQSARQRRGKDGGTGGGSTAPPSQDNSLGDYGGAQGDDDDTMEQNEGGGLGGRGAAKPEEDMELEDSGEQGLIGIHEAIVRSIEKCGESVVEKANDIIC